MSDQLFDTIGQIINYDKDKVLRPTYGETSLKDYEGKYELMLSRLKFIREYAPLVDKKTNDLVYGALQPFKNSISALVNYDQSQYVSNKNNITRDINTHFDTLNQYWPHYVCAAIEKLGLLSNSNIQDEFKTISQNLKTTTEEALKKINRESSEIIKQATIKANEIEQSVRKTAQKISVQEAQVQFNEAASYHLIQSRIWGGVILFLIILFVCYISYLLNVELNDVWTWKILYYTAIRISLLTLLSTILAFSFKILKSHMHLQQHNLHRKRISNSMSAFVESANTKEQRDSILSQLVSSVSTFGTTGIFDTNNEGGPKISVDTFTKNIEHITPEK